MHHEPREIAGIRRAIRTRDHRNFAGAVARSHRNLAGHLFLRAFGGSYGEHTDWQDVDTWADGIASQLVGGPEADSA
jgi:menaquinone-dependent protoporphyrinogen oxidase